jgi:hypothetical protein
MEINQVFPILVAFAADRARRRGIEHPGAQALGETGARTIGKEVSNKGAE